MFTKGVGVLTIGVILVLIAIVVGAWGLMLIYPLVVKTFASGAAAQGLIETTVDYHTAFWFTFGVAIIRAVMAVFNGFLIAAVKAS